MAVVVLRLPAALPSDETTVVTDWLGWSLREEAFRTWNDDKWRHELAAEMESTIFG